MALLKLKSNTLELEVFVGILENYQPNDKIKQIYAACQALKTQTKAKLREIVGDIENSEISETLSKNSQMKDLWKTYLETEYNTKLTKIIAAIEKQNKQLCPNYDELENK